MEQELKSYANRSVSDILTSLEASYDEEDYEEEDYDYDEEDYDYEEGDYDYEEEVEDYEDNEEEEVI
jgi:hypothetical protein